MPSLGADMDAGTVVEWRVHPGDAVHRGDVVAVIDTDKSDIDAEVFEDGVIGELLVGEGEKVPVGTPLATIVAASAAPATPEVTAPPPAAVPDTTPEAPPRRSRARGARGRVVSPVVRRLARARGVDTTALAGTGAGEVVTRHDVEVARPRALRPLVSPRARALAAREAVDAAALHGTGPNGAVIGADVLSARSAVEAVPTAPRPPRGDSMQQRIASLMERANREIPHYWVTRDIDFSRASSWLSAYNATRPPAERCVAAALLLTATARAAAAVAGFNGHYVDGAYRPADSVELGIVVVVREGGLLVPVLHDAATLTVAETMAQMGDVVRRARSGHLRSSEVAQPTISVSNLGDQGADEVLAVIYPPQVALVGFGRVRERPWAEGGLLGVRPVVTASLAGDHRVSDGHQASRLLAAIDDALQHPESLEEVTP